MNELARRLMERVQETPCLPDQSLTYPASGRPWKQIRKPLLSNDLRIGNILVDVALLQRGYSVRPSGSTARRCYAIACARGAAGDACWLATADVPDSATMRARLGFVFAVALRESTMRSA